jgi:hypothetical protein
VKGTDSLEDLGTEGRIILKRIVGKWGEGLWTAFISPIIWTVGAVMNLRVKTKGGNLFKWMSDIMERTFLYVVG